jgi:ADP-ribosylglycohydrolase
MNNLLIGKNDFFDKILGNFLGVAIGDSLGKPVEMCKPQNIAEKYGRITDYLDCSSHKYFSGDDKGTTTDDWQLTKAVARAMITTGEINLDEIAAEHVREFSVTVAGWGGSTREAVARIAEGVHWSSASKTEKENRGFGNGVCMKVSPIGLYMALTNPNYLDPPWSDHIQKIADMATMTHNTSIAVTSGLAHAFATFNCFSMKPEEFDKDKFLRVIISASQIGRQYCPDTLVDDMQTRFEKLHKVLSTKEIVSDFGGGSCYVFDSLPFTYAFFLNNPYSVDSLYDCVSAGGDADSNGSMVGGLLGALHGANIFPQHLIDGLANKEEVYSLATAFYEKFALQLN